MEQKNEPKKLRRSATMIKLGGVCGGLAEYFNADVTIFRLIFAIAAVFSFLIPATIAYLVMWIIIPKNPYN